MTRPLPRFAREAVAAAAVAVALAACGGEPPALPPEDTLIVPELKVGSSGALTFQAGETTNVTIAAGSVLAVTGGVGLAMALPRLVFAGVLTQEPEQEDDTWIWRRSFPLLGGDAELHGRTDGGLLELEMHVFGKRDSLRHLDDFVWYTGEHRRGSGKWEIFDPGTPEEPGPAGAVVRIDWRRDAADDKELSFTNVRQASPKEGDAVVYELLGEIASMAIHDEHSGNSDDGAASDFAVHWQVETGEGIMTHGTDRYCWETLDNGQIDMSCPTDGADWRAAL